MKTAEHSIRHEKGEEGVTKRKKPMDIWNMEVEGRVVWRTTRREVARERRDKYMPQKSLPCKSSCPHL